jgi:hypothetical protein
MLEGGRLLAERYRLLEKIGEGGAAEVFRAKDQRLDRIVAVKLLRPQLTFDQTSRNRFVIEAKAAAGLSHPNIVDIYDFGEGPDGSMFIAMQYIEGQNLKDILQKRGRLSPAEVVSICQQVCYALSVAHAAGLIHRDVKPQNIMIDPKGNVRLTDFGIVKALSAPALTQSGMTFGTAAYLSPEQATGAPVGPASDIYALGCVMYEMLSGVPPFTGENPAIVAYKQVWEQPRPLHELVPEVPPSLEGIVMRCLNKDPERRYPSAQALAEALESLSVSFNQPTQAVSVGLGAMAAAGANAGQWTPAEARAPAERSQAIPMPAPSPVVEAAGAGGGGTVVPPVKAHTTAPNPVVVPHAQPPTQRVAPYTAQGVRNVQVVDVDRRRSLGWVPALVVILLGLGMCGIAAFQGGFLGALGGTTTPTPAPTNTVTQAPPAPTTTLGGVVIGSPVSISPVPPLTDTPIPPTDTPVPTEVPTRPPQPTETPLPPAAEVTNTPEPEPPTPTAAPVPEGNRIVVDDSSFSGGFTNNRPYHGRTAQWVYGQGTQYSTMTASFNMDNPPGDGANLTIVGVDSEDPGKNPISVTLNGVVIYQGDDPLPNDTRNGPGGPGNWGSFTAQVPAGVLQAGGNTLTISNLSSSSCTNCPAFVMIDYAVISW